VLDTAYGANGEALHAPGAKRPSGGRPPGLVRTGRCLDV